MTYVCTTRDEDGMMCCWTSGMTKRFTGTSGGDLIPFFLVALAAGLVQVNPAQKDLEQFSLGNGMNWSLN